MEALRKEKIGIIYFYHRVWINQLNFYLEELEIFQEWLEDLASRNTLIECRTGIEQFQNRFIIQKREAEDLKELIRLEGREIAATGKIHVTRAAYEVSEEYRRLQDRVQRYEELFKALKNDFYRFSSIWI